MTLDSTGNITALGTPYSRRTPWYSQSDFNFAHEIKVNHNNESQVVGFDVNVINLFNQHAVTAYYQGMNSIYAERVGETPPARSTIEVAGLPSGALVEIEAVALL